MVYVRLFIMFTESNNNFNKVILSLIQFNGEKNMTLRESNIDIHIPYQPYQYLT